VVDFDGEVYREIILADGSPPHLIYTHSVQAVQWQRMHPASCIQTIYYNTPTKPTGRSRTQLESFVNVQ